MTIYMRTILANVTGGLVMENSFYSEEELNQLGIKSYGNNVLISKKASIYGAEKITIGSNVRIDDFVILSGKITIGSYAHIANYTALYGGDTGIRMGNYSTVSSRCAIYAISDDYSGMYMTNPMVPHECIRYTCAEVVLKQHVVVGTCCTILPGCILEEGASVGAMSLINRSLESWGIYHGIPCRRMKDRKKDLLQYVEIITNRMN